MCRKIKTLFNFDAFARKEAMRGASLQFAQKLSGFRAPQEQTKRPSTVPSKRLVSPPRNLLDSLVTSAETRNRGIESLRARARATGRYAYHPHMFCRLGMNISKRAKFPWDWVEWLAGHELGTQEAYLPTVDEAAETWRATMEPKMTAFLSGNGNWASAE